MTLVRDVTEATLRMSTGVEIGPDEVADVDPLAPPQRDLFAAADLELVTPATIRRLYVGATEDYGTVPAAVWFDSDPPGVFRLVQADGSVVDLFSLGVVVTGVPTVGETLTASGAATDLYQWYRDGIAIDGATAQTYVLAAGDADADVSCARSPCSVPVTVVAA